jgi:hypothetical protein
MDQDSGNDSVDSAVNNFVIGVNDTVGSIANARSVKTLGLTGIAIGALAAFPDSSSLIEHAGTDLALTTALTGALYHLRIASRVGNVPRAYHAGSFLALLVPLLAVSGLATYGTETYLQNLVLEQ